MPSYPRFRQINLSWWNPLSWLYLAILLAWLPIAAVLFIAFHAFLLVAFAFFWLLNRALEWLECR